ncbi:hypothetical protein HMN09_00455900 [Mycena chlorophos]|uniref:Uncharacterized protein n=1 Tax=Mycena chlorophos TaxID=658473 RepID=A0A8H6THA5_MYCCL|nr:hypothetical protein HMN09_00455900 [Mycena chlorophos]
MDHDHPLPPTFSFRAYVARALAQNAADELKLERDKRDPEYLFQKAKKRMDDKLIASEMQQVKAKRLFVSGIKMKRAAAAAGTGKRDLRDIYENDSELEDDVHFLPKRQKAGQPGPSAPMAAEVPVKSSRRRRPENIADKSRSAGSNHITTRSLWNKSLVQVLIMTRPRLLVLVLWPGVFDYGPLSR